MVLPLLNATKSFWIEAADSDLRNHRSTPDLPREVDVVIVGSGYTGATAAYWLHRYTQHGTTPSMLMLEARDICGGATGRNGGQLRPHLYSRWPKWSARFGVEGALALIEHEHAHLSAFRELLEEEGLVEETAFKLGETFDAAMTPEALDRLKAAYEQMQRDLGGADGPVIRECRLIEDRKEAEEVTQMKGCLGAIVHPSGQVWPYRFVHALLHIVLKTGKLNLQAHTPVNSIGDRRADGRTPVHTDRGTVLAKTVIHATNRWAPHLIPTLESLVYPGRATLAAIKAPQGFFHRTGAQHWDSVVNNYHLQLPPPYNSIIIGGAKAIITKDPSQYVNNDREDQQMDGVPDFYARWPAKDVVGWQGGKEAELELPVHEGGVWTGVYGDTADAFPFVGRLPGEPAAATGQYVAAGFNGHGMPRILLSTAHLVGVVLQDMGVPHQTPALAKHYPPLPQPFHLTPTRLERLRKIDIEADIANEIQDGLASSKKGFAFAMPDSLDEGVAIPPAAVHST